MLITEKNKQFKVSGLMLILDVCSIIFLDQPNVSESVIHCLELKSQLYGADMNRVVSLVRSTF